ncbi:MAG: leucine-rich repeat protein [Prevotella sp.]|nr:leucine-rich repeat protein [Prevotella sp.]
MKSKEYHKGWMMTIAMVVCLLTIGNTRIHAYTAVEGFVGETWYDHRSTGFEHGSGTQRDPYVISSAGELALIAWKANEEGNTFSGVFFKLGADISLNNYGWVPIGCGGDHCFKGTLTNPDEYTISNMRLKANGTDKTDLFGLFGKIIGKVDGIKLEKSVISVTVPGQCCVGAICGLLGTREIRNNSGIVSNCRVQADFVINAGEASSVGGIIGEGDSHESLRRCVVEADMRVFNVGMTGGIAGFIGSTAKGGLVQDCHANVNITGVGDVATSFVDGDACRYGGLIGFSYVSSFPRSLEFCSAAGEIKASGSCDQYIGGLIGSFYSENLGAGNLPVARLSVSSVTISGKGRLGGLVGSSMVRGTTYHNLENCFSCSYIDGSEAEYVGGIVGYVYYTQSSNGNAYYGKDCTFAGTIKKPKASKYYGSIVGRVERLLSSAASAFGTYRYDRLMCDFRPCGKNAKYGTVTAFCSPPPSEVSYSVYLEALWPVYSQVLSETICYRDIFELCSYPFHITTDSKTLYCANDVSADFSLRNYEDKSTHEKLTNYAIEPASNVSVSKDFIVRPLDPGEVIVEVTHKNLKRKVHLYITYGNEWDGTSTTEGTAESNLFDGGDGSEQNPFMIHNVAQLSGAISSKYNSSKYYFKLSNDLFFNNHLLTDNGTPRSDAQLWTPRDWKAHLNGNGKILYGLYVDEPSAEPDTNYGLFDHLSGSVSDLGIVDSYVCAICPSFSYSDLIGVGMLCGHIVESASVERCMAHGRVVSNKYLGGLCGVAGFRSAPDNIRIVDCFTSVHQGPPPEDPRYPSFNTQAAIAVGSVNVAQRCLSVGRMDFVSNGMFSDKGTECYLDKQMSENVVYSSSGMLTSQLTDGHLFKGWDNWVQEEGRYPMLRQFASSSYGDLLTMPVMFFADDEKVDRAGNVTEIFEFLTDDAQWSAYNGDTYLDVIQECAAASLNQRTGNEPEFLVGRSTIDRSKCTQALRSIALNVNVDGKVGIRFKDPEAESACMTAFDNNPQDNVITLRESFESTVSDFKERFNPHAANVRYFPELRYFAGIKRMENGMISGLSQLEEVEMPKQLRNLGPGVFSGCDALPTVMLPSSFRMAEPGAFYQSSITDIFVAKKNPQVVSRQGLLFTDSVNTHEDVYYLNALMAYPPARGQDTATVCGPLSAILEGAFYRIPNLRSIYIDNPLPEGERAELMPDGIIHEQDNTLMQIYINDGSSHGATLENVDEPVLFPEYADVNMLDEDDPWLPYVEAGCIERYFPLRVGPLGWHSLYIGFATRLPEQLKAYIVRRAELEEHVAELKRTANLLPHETPVLIKAEEPGTYLLYPEHGKVYELNKSWNRLTGSYIGQNDQFGTPVNQEGVNRGSLLTLGLDDEGEIGLFYYQHQGEIPPYEAFLYCNLVGIDEHFIPYYIFDIDDDPLPSVPTAITDNNSRLTGSSSVFYTLDGRKIEGRPTVKGIYINNGRKVVVR